MTETEYGAWLTEAIRGYARERVASGQWTERSLIALEEEALRLGPSGIALGVFGHNTVAEALYAKLGFRPTNIHLLKTIEARSQPC